MIKRLDWFPKATGPGDMDAVGGRKLLGSNSLDAAELLVRETAQNSWDARLPGVPVEYGVRARRLNPGQTRVLQGVLAGPPEHLGLGVSSGQTQVVEIFDRGTAGLGGPTRNDLAVPAGQVRNFIDFVLNLGAPRDTEMGGGTYGFGKTASYVASEIGTVVIWTRTLVNNRMEQRLVASAMSESFEQDGRTYTGRHWWGRHVEGRVEPVLDGDAEAIAAQLFARGFEESETGTSLLIVRPLEVLGANSDEIAEVCDQAARLHLWPKAMEGQEPSRSMTLTVGTDEFEWVVEPGEEFAPYEECLRAVRHVQAGASPEGLRNPMVVVKDIRGGGQLLGHLALAKFPIPAGNSQRVERDVCWMRHDAELVVKYDEQPALEGTGLQWCGVFKPTAQVDDEFAAAEPPAHDDWVVRTKVKGQRSNVRIALNKIKDEVRGFLRPAIVAKEVSTAGSTGALAAALSDLAGGPTELAPAAKRSARSGGGRGSKSGGSSVAVIGQHVDWATTGSTILVDIEITTARRTEVVPRLGVAVDGAVDWNAEAAVVKGWRMSGSDRLRSDNSLMVEGDTVAQLVVEAPRGVALDLRFTMEEVR